MLTRTDRGRPSRGPCAESVIDVFEQLELDRFARPVGRLDAIDDHPADSADEIGVEKRDRRFQLGGQLRLPIVPSVELHVLPSHPAAGPIENVQVIAGRIIVVKDAIQRGPARGIDRLNCQPNIRRA